jgi:beta-glucosidase
VTKVRKSGSSVSVTVSVGDTGSRSVDLVVPIYASQPQSAVLVPAKRLAAFTRVSLAAGQTKKVTVTFPKRVLDVVQGDMNASGPPSLEHGQYVFSTGTVTDAAHPSAANTITL